MCADRHDFIAEMYETNNCTNTGERLHIIPRRWTGSITGSSTLTEGVTESWIAKPMTFKFDSYAGGYFDYRAYGDVKYTVSGTDVQGCTWSGSGTTIGNRGTLAISDHFGSYWARASITTPFYTITISCPGVGTFTQNGPVNGEWFNTGTPDPKITDPFGVTALKGSTTGGTNYAWDLAAN